MPAGLGPVERQMRIAELAVGSESDVIELTEIVRVQFEQIGQDRFLVR